MKNKVLLFFLGAFLFSSCAVLKPPTVVSKKPIDGYKYVYVAATSDVSSVYNVGMGTVQPTYWGNTVGGMVSSGGSRTANPGELIGGHFIKRGYVKLIELDPKLLDETLVVVYGESGRRKVGFGYTIEITVQITSAKDHEVLCVGTAEGQGSTETDDVRIAVDRCMTAIFDGVK